MFIKVSFADKVRKFKLGDSAAFTELQAELVRCFGEKAQLCNLGYVDAEGELITIASEEDWKVCVEEAAELSKNKAILTVSIKLTPSEASEFVTIEPEKVSQSQIHDQSSSEITEEPLESKPVEHLPEGKVIQEVEVPAEVLATPVEATPEPEPVMEQEKPAEATPEQPDLEAIVNSVKNVLGGLFGIEVDVVDAKLEDPEEPRLSTHSSTSSTLTNEMREEISSLIDQKLAQTLRASSTTQPTQVQKKNFTHRGITCDGCQKGIHNMARFKSLVFDDYDLCEECERKGIHSGPMVRFAEPTHVNASVLNQKFRQFSQVFAEQQQEAPQRPNWGGRRCGGFRRNHCQQQQQAQANKGPFDGCGLPNGFPFDILKIVPGLFQGLTKKNQPTQTQTQNHEMNDKPQCPPQLLELIRTAKQFIPHIDEETLVQIVQQNGFTTPDQLVNYLLN